EDGIRDGHVTGVQTCALPIYTRRQQGNEHLEGDVVALAALHEAARHGAQLAHIARPGVAGEQTLRCGRYPAWAASVGAQLAKKKIGRASCRERVEERGEGAIL